MINLSTSEGNAFDILSILQVKAKRFPIEKNVLNYFNCLDEIKSQVGGQLFFVVLNSQEYRELYLTNFDCFDAVDKAKSDLVLASVVDKLNHQRFLYKTKIQEKFFEGQLTEQKIGY
jgi:hypothetical protein